MERRSWPSIAILSPEGCPLIFLNGEGQRPTIDLFLEAAINYYDDRLDREPIEIYLEEEKDFHDRELKSKKVESLTKEERAALNSNLRFPSKLIWIANQPWMPYDCNVMVISDTGNNRIVLVNIETMECTIGNWYIGLVDGDFNECSFHQL